MVETIRKHRGKRRVEKERCGIDKKRGTKNDVGGVIPSYELWLTSQRPRLLVRGLTNVGLFVEGIGVISGICRMFGNLCGLILCGFRIGFCMNV